MFRALLRLAAPLTIPVIAALTMAALPARADDASLFPDLRREGQDLSTALRTQLLGFGSAFGDKNDISLYQGGVEAKARPLPELPMALRLSYGEIEQQAKDSRPHTDYDRFAAQLLLGEVFVTPAFGLVGRINVEAYHEQDDTLLGGRLEARYHLNDGSTIGAWGSRESFWTDQDGRDPRTYNRLVDLSQLRSRDFHMDRAGAYADLRLDQRSSVYVEGGGDHYEDDNHRAWGYAQYQTEVLDSGPGRWTALQPNVYAEFTDRRDPAYFSPAHHVSLGAGLHTIRDFQRAYGTWTLEAEVNPQGLLTDDRAGVGAHGALDVSLHRGDWVVGLGGFGYADTQEYWLWRALLRLGYTF